MSLPTVPATDPRNAVSILSVTPFEEDQFWLQDIIGHSNWRLYRADGLQSALAVLHTHEIGVVLSEFHAPPHSWTGILDVIHYAQDAPALIVTSRLADKRLWAEVLNQGAFDVLAKPFDRDEVLRTVSSAWLNWHRNHRVAAGPGRDARAS